MEGVNYLMKPNRILWINPVGTPDFDQSMGGFVKRHLLHGTEVDVVSLPQGRPEHLEFHSYEALVIPDIVSIVHHYSADYSAIVIACYYDVCLREAREVSQKAIIIAPCQASVSIVSHLANQFSVLVGRKKWIPKMTENIHHYGAGNQLASMRSLDLTVHQLEVDPNLTLDRMEREARLAVDQDGAEAIILGCTVEFEFQARLTERLGIPVIDAVAAPFEFAQMLGRASNQHHWYPSRAHGSESPPQDEIIKWTLFGQTPPIGNFLSFQEIR